MACIRALCIRALDMIEYQVISRLIFRPKHILWVLKKTVEMGRFFQASNYNLNLMSLKKKYVLDCIYLDSDVYSMQV